MKVSIITVCYNSERTLADAMDSVLAQTYKNIEYLVVDGRSTDETLNVVKKFEPRFGGRMKWISEPDKGIYDAMNKGIQLATGDIIGMLNSDDFFTKNDVVEKIVAAFQSNHVDALYGDVCFVKPANLKRVVRYYSAAFFKPPFLRFGFMPPHPGFYVRKEKYSELGLYKTDYKISADYELLIRFLNVNRIKTKYLDFCVVTMRTGGDSTRNIKSNWILNREIVRGCRENGMYTNMVILLFKYFFKISGVLFPNRRKKLHRVAQ